MRPGGDFLKTLFSSKVFRFIIWKGGRAVECTGFENQRGLKVTEGSNPSLSENFYQKFKNDKYCFFHFYSPAHRLGKGRKVAQQKQG